MRNRKWKFGNEEIMKQRNGMNHKLEAATIINSWMNDSVFWSAS